MWQKLEIYGLGDKALAVIKSFYKQSRTCVRMAGNVGKCFGVINDFR